MLPHKFRIDFSHDLYIFAQKIIKKSILVIADSEFENQLNFNQSDNQLERL